MLGQQQRVVVLCCYDVLRWPTPALSLPTCLPQGKKGGVKDLSQAKVGGILDDIKCTDLHFIRVLNKERRAG